MNSSVASPAEWDRLSARAVTALLDARPEQSALGEDSYLTVGTSVTGGPGVEGGVLVGDTGYTVTDVHTEPYKKKGLFGH